jgi:RHS repeat-associated protein
MSEIALSGRKCLAAIKRGSHVKALHLVACFCFVGALLAPVGCAQNYLSSAGQPTYSTPQSVELGFVDAATGNLHIEIPLGSYPQRANRDPLVYRLAYDSNIWSISSTSNTWVPGQGGWSLFPLDYTVNFSRISAWSTIKCQADYVWIDSAILGTSRYFPNIPVNPNKSGCPLTGDAFAADSSGYHMYVTQSGTSLTISVYAPDGSLVNQTPGLSDPNQQTPDTIFSEDSNGNYTLAGNQEFMDTLGRNVFANGSAVSVPISQSTASSHPFFFNIEGQYTKNMATIQLRTHFGQSGVTECTTSCTTSVLQSLVLPDGSSYTFKYDCDSTTGNAACGSPSGQSAYYGNLISTTLPTGAMITYSYLTFQNQYGNMQQWLTSKSEPGGGNTTFTPAILTSCSSGQVGCQSQTTVKRPDGNYRVYVFTINNGPWQTSTKYYDASGSLLQTSTSSYDFSNACQPLACIGASYIRRTSEMSTLVTGTLIGLSKQTTYSYDSAQKGNVTAVEEWKLYPGTSPTFPSVPDRGTYISYLTTGENNINRPVGITICSNSGSDPANCPGGGSRVSQTLYTYDSYGGGLTTQTGIFNHDHTNFGPAITARGNPTTIKKWVSGSTYLTTSLSYDEIGNVLSVTDSNNNTITDGYADNFYSDAQSAVGFASLTYFGSPTYQNTDAYLTSVTYPLIGTQRYGYYFGDGKIANSTNPNGEKVTAHFLDVLDRTTEEDFPVGWQLATYTGQTQADTYKAVADTSPSSGCSSCMHQKITIDSFGRETGRFLLNDPAGQVEVDNTYDAVGRVGTVSHPHVGASDPDNVSETYQYDALDRKVAIIHPDGAETQVIYAQTGTPVTTYGGFSSQVGSTTTYGYGLSVFVVDEAAHAKQEWTDGFGKVIEVDELLSTPPNYYLTNYIYDVVGNLTQVVQGAQTRTYLYDGLSRLIQETTPEGGTVSYSYTNGGFPCSGNPSNVCSRTAPAPNQSSPSVTVTTTYCYDALNRLISKGYSAQPLSCPIAGPAVSYQYDQGGASSHALGRLTTVTDSTGTEQYAYDSAGRISQIAKTLGGISYTSGYLYNAGNEVTQITYPSGRVLTESYDAIGQVSGVSSGGVNYTSSVSWTAAGNPASVLYGNRALTIRAYSPTRLQLTQLEHRSSTVTRSLYRAYYYYAQDPNNCPNGAPKNNGLIQCIVDGTSSTDALGRSVSYTYDSVNRLVGAVSRGSATYPQWGLSWSYDQYGNRLSQSQTTGSPPMNSLSFSANAGALTNRPDGYPFDAAGNINSDGQNGLTYDNENRLITSGNSATGTSYYYYDDNGKRVKKTALGNSTLYIFSGDKVLAEYPAGAAASSPSIEYIYSHGTLVASVTPGTTTTTTYYYSDHLSIRATSGTSGTLSGEQGHFPFGEAWYQANTTSKFIFTSYERDQESGNDYALARLYINRFGRFCSVDPVQGSPDDPQSWNRYSYARNNPINIADRSGEGWLSWLIRGIFAILSILFPPGAPFFAIGGLATPPIIDNGPFSDTTATLNSIYHPVDPSRFGINNFLSQIPAFSRGKYDDCAKSVFGATSGRVPGDKSRSIPSYEAISAVSEATFPIEANPALTAITMAYESNSNLNVATNDDQDVGPMQVNLYWAERGSPVHIYADTFGTNVYPGQPFNGDAVSNIRTGALKLKELGNHPENYAPRSRRAGRKNNLKKLLPAFTSLFDCLYR